MRFRAPASSAACTCSTQSAGVPATVEAHLELMLDLQMLALQGDLTNALPGKSVRIQGKLQMYRGRMEVILNHPAQLTILTNSAATP